MKTRIAAAVTALVLGVAPISSAMAFGPEFPFASSSPRDVETTGSIGGRANTSVPFYGACPMSSASEATPTSRTSRSSNTARPPAATAAKGDLTMSEMKLLRAVSYGMIGVLAGGLAMTVVGTANA